MIAVETRNLTVKLGENTPLDEVSCQIHHGEFVAVLGPNGAGKSVFLKTVLGLFEPAAGEVLVYGKPPGRVEPSSLGYVPQLKTFDRSFPALAEELVATGLHLTWRSRLSAGDRQLVRASLETVGAAHLASRSLGGLSGGELQRVYLARALIRKPRLVLLDEPVTGIDSVGESDFYRVLEAYRQEHGATIIMVTHDWEIASHYGCHVLVLNRRVISFGSPAEALCEDCLKRAYGVSRGGPPVIASCPRPEHGHRFTR